MRIVPRNKQAFMLRKSTAIFNAAIEIYTRSKLDQDKSIKEAEEIYKKILDKYEPEDPENI